MEFDSPKKINSYGFLSFINVHKLPVVKNEKQ